MVIEMKEIAQYILQKLGDRIYKDDEWYYFITTDGKVYTGTEYYSLLEEHSNAPPAYIYVMHFTISQWVYDDPMWYNSCYYYPFITLTLFLLRIYLQKYYYYKDQFGQLKYMAIILNFSLINKTIMEVIDIDAVADNIRLQDLLQILNREDDEEEDDEEERLSEFEERFINGVLFDGYNFEGVMQVVKRYYGDKDGSLADADDIKTISNDYQRIFQSYRVELTNEELKNKMRTC